jgi:hypothetical protein
MPKALCSTSSTKNNQKPKLQTTHLGKQQSNVLHVDQSMETGARGTATQRQGEPPEWGVLGELHHTGSDEGSCAGPGQRSGFSLIGT